MSTHLRGLCLLQQWSEQVDLKGVEIGHCLHHGVVASDGGLFEYMLPACTFHSPCITLPFVGLCCMVIAFVDPWLVRMATTSLDDIVQACSWLGPHCMSWLDGVLVVSAETR